MAVEQTNEVHTGKRCLAFDCKTVLSDEADLENHLSVAHGYGPKWGRVLAWNWWPRMKRAAR